MLVSSSPVFKQKIKRSEEESKEVNEIRFDNCSIETMRKILEWIYTGEIEWPEDIEDVIDIC